MRGPHTRVSMTGRAESKIEAKGWMEGAGIENFFLQASHTHSGGSLVRIGLSSQRPPEVVRTHDPHSGSGVASLNLAVLSE